MMDSIKSMFGSIRPGQFRMSMNGIAAKTSSGYKTYDVDTGRLVNVSDFVFDVGEDMFFLIPSNDIKRGDVIIANGLPAAVIKVEDNLITAFRYEDSTIINLVPEHLVFFGNTYFYSKVVSFFTLTDKKSMKDMLPLMFMSSMFKGSSPFSNGSGNNNNMMQMMMMASMMGKGGMFDGLADGLNEAMGEVTKAFDSNATTVNDTTSDAE